MTKHVSIQVFAVANIKEPLVPEAILTKVAALVGVARGQEPEKQEVRMMLTIHKGLKQAPLGQGWHHPGRGGAALLTRR